MAGIGGDSQHLLLVTVQRKGVKAKLLVPENIVEFLEQRRGLYAQFLRTSGRAKFVEYLGHAQPRIIHVTLQFAESFRPSNQRAVRIYDAVSRVLPTHVLIAD